MVRDQNKNSDQWDYEPSLVDLRFLKAADYIVGKNKADNIKPDTDSSISKMIYGHSNIIREIRNFQRGVTMPQLQKFAIYFHLDFNYFFRHTMILEYHPQTAGGNENTDIMAHTIGTIIGDKMKGTIYMGDVYIIKTKKTIIL